MPETLVAQVRVGGEHLDVDDNLTDRRRTRILEIEQDVATNDRGRADRGLLRTGETFGHDVADLAAVVGADAVEPLGLLVDLLDGDGRRLDIRGLRIAVGQQPIPLVAGHHQEATDDHHTEDCELAGLKTSQGCHTQVWAADAPA